MQLALLIATDEQLDARYNRAIREGDEAAIAACRLELVCRRPIEYVASAMAQQRKFERGMK